jgi:hypothetical protein
MAADEIDKKRKTTAAHHPTRQTANKTGINGNKNNADNAVDVIESFHVIDQEKMGEITAQQCMLYRNYCKSHYTGCGTETIETGE